MAVFIVRVELHGTKSLSDYDGLHQMMQLSGYLRQITSDDGRVFKLPSATYNREAGAPASASAICDQVKSIANKTHFQNAVLVTEMQECAWVGLEEVRKTPPLGLGALGQNPLYSPTTETLLGGSTNALGLGAVQNNALLPPPAGTIFGGLYPTRR